jgi:6,7-dimethyl-8-ribityllumazine synthase
MRSTSRPSARSSATSSTPANGRRDARASGRFVILASQFHPALSRALIDGARRALGRRGIADSAVQLCWVPGAFELPVAALWAARSRPRPRAIIALGALIRGETLQYEVLAHAVAQGLMQVALTTGVPVTFGVVVARTLAQAKARAGGAHGNRGEEAAQAALGLLRLCE